MYSTVDVQGECEALEADNSETTTLGGSRVTERRMRANNKRDQVAKMRQDRAAQKRLEKEEMRRQAEEQRERERLRLEQEELERYTAVVLFV